MKVFLIAIGHCGILAVIGRYSNNSLLRDWSISIELYGLCCDWSISREFSVT